MKKLVCNLYSFDELSDDAKHNVCEEERNRDYNWGYISQSDHAEERKSTLDAFCDVFGIKYEIDYDHCHRFITWHFEDDLEWKSEEITGKYIWRFLNKYYYKIRSRKWFSTCMYKTKDGRVGLDLRKAKGSKDKYSKIIWEEQNCPFTGMCYDCDILDKIFEWYKKPDCVTNLNYTLHDLFQDCFDHYLKCWQEEDDYDESDEGIGEMIIANWGDKLYFKDGTEFTGDYDDVTPYLEEDAA